MFIKNMSKVNFDKFFNILDNNKQILELIKDLNGYHCILRILECKDEFYRSKIIDKINLNIIDTCTNIYGSKLIQKTLDVLSIE